MIAEQLASVRRELHRLIDHGRNYSAGANALEFL